MDAKLFGTTDFYTICVLLATGSKVDKIATEGERGQIKRFFFENTESLQDTLLKHSNGTLSLPSLDLINAIDNVKRMLRY
jgi:hypothetical protein